MHKQDLSQLELFSGNGSQQAGHSEPAFSVSFLSYIRAYEKVIFVLIGFLLTAVIAFCCGVQRGKTMAKEAVNARMDLAQSSVRPVAPVAVSPQKTYPVAPSGQEPAVVATARVPAVAASRLVSDRQPAAGVAAQASPVVPVSVGSYTIQVGSYAQAQLALKESASLKKKGFNALLVRKGKYTILCVGTFTSKENAQSVLSKLKRTYGDCYIRRL